MIKIRIDPWNYLSNSIYFRIRLAGKYWYRPVKFIPSLNQFPKNRYIPREGKITPKTEKSNFLFRIEIVWSPGTDQPASYANKDVT